MHRLPERDLQELLAQSPEAWPQLANARIFVTGGTGFLGCWLLESMLRANECLGTSATAVVLSRDPSPFLQKAPHIAGSPHIELVQGDVRNFDPPDGSFTHVVHAATDASEELNRNRPLEMLDTITTGTRRVLDFAVSCGARKFLFISAGAVYGTQPPELHRLHEEYPGAPFTHDHTSAYAHGKRLAEFLCTTYHRQFGLETTIARGFAFIGPHLPLDRHFAAGNFIRDALRGEAICVNGDGTPFRSYLYASEAVAWLWTILMRGTPGRAYNVGSEAEVSIAQLANTVAEAFVPARRVRIAHQPVPGSLAARYVPSTERAAAELGLRQTIDLPEAVRRTVEWYSAGPDS